MPREGVVEGQIVLDTPRYQFFSFIGQGFGAAALRSKIIQIFLHLVPANGAGRLADEGI